MAGGGGGSVMNYDFGNKRHWRRWVWNRIVERLLSSPREARCIYLPGASDEDMPVASSRGLLRANMIAVERDAATRKSLRARGVLTVDADFFLAVDAIATTAAHGFDRVDVVFADLCHGVTADPINAIRRWMAYPTLRNCVFAFNLMRGRERGIGALLSALHGEEWARHKPGDKPHRGQVLMHSAFCLVATADEHVRIGEPVSEKAQRRYDWMRVAAKSATTSYRSPSNQTFDTVVFANPMRLLPPLQVDVEALMATSGLTSRRDFIRARRSVAAVLAHRTRRLGA